jgi:poly(A) polymerase
VIDGRPFEVTSLREDVETFGRHASVRFGRDWRVDAEAARLHHERTVGHRRRASVHDYVGGIADLDARRVRFIGEAQKRIAEDYLRILRFFRFHAAYGHGQPDAAGLHACIAARANSDNCRASECGWNCSSSCWRGRRHPPSRSWPSPACWCPVLGGVPDLAGFQNMAKVEAAAGLQADAVQRLGALGARIGEDAERLWQRLRLSNAEHDRLKSMAEAWWRISPATTRLPARCSIAWDRAVRRSRAACVGALTCHRARSGLGARSWACPSTGPRRSFRSRPPISSSVACRRGRRWARPLHEAEEAWIAADFPADQAAIAAIAAAAAAEVRPM